MSDISQEALIGLMEALRDPIKKAKIFEGLLAHNKIKHHTPLNKVKRLHCESPTSLQRRRALQEVKDNTSDSASSTSDPSESSTEIIGPKLPLDKILIGVIAFVEVKLAGKEQSEGIKMIVQSMGATIRDKFTRDVTHVIFKDGSFKTYEKAKLLKCHLVSVLWVDAVRRNSARVSEAKYRPFGPQSDNPDISILCTKLQKDYEAIVKDEKRRSFSLPRFSKVHDKRKTMHASSSTNFSSFRKSLKAQPLSSDVRKRTPSPGITSDDSDCGIVNGHSFNYLKNVYPSSTPSITDDSSAVKSPQVNNISKNSSGSNRNAKISDTSSSKASSLLIADSSAEKPVSKPVDFYEMVQPASQIISANSTNDSRSLITRRKSRSRKTINKEIDMDITSNIVDHNFNMDISSERQILKEAAVVLSPNISTDSDRTPSDIFRKSSEKTGTTMSSLRVSSDSNLCRINGSNKENTVQSTMSSLRLSKDLHTPNKPLVSQSLSCLLGNKSAISASPKRNVTTRKKTASLKNSVRKNLDADLPLSLNFEESPGSSKKTIPSNMKIVFNTPQAVSLRNSSSNIATETNTNKSVDKNTQRSASSCSTSTCSTDNSKSCGKTRAKKVREIGLSDSDVETTPSPIKIQKKIEAPVKKTIRRKLYDPDDVHALNLPDDEQEREERFNKKMTPAAKFVDPNSISTLSVAKKGRKNLDKNEIESGPSSSKNVRKSAKKCRKQLDVSQPETEPNSSNKVPNILNAKRVQTRRDSQLISQNDESHIESEDEEVQSLTQISLRRSQRISVSERKPRYNYSSASSATTTTEDFPIRRIVRRSTLDFQSMSLSQKQRMFKNDQVSSIVCTKFHRDECDEFQRIVKKLGRFYYENNVTEQTTHVVAGECKRTLNILRGIARGCWILKHEWLLESDQEGRWLPEEEYELTEFSKAVQKCRLERQAFGPSFSMDIFANCGNIYVGAHTNPPTKDLKQLIILCKGTVTMQPHNAKISVGQIVAGDDIVCVNELWVLDSITYNKLEKTSKFLIQPLREDSPEF